MKALTRLCKCTSLSRPLYHSKGQLLLKWTQLKFRKFILNMASVLNVSLWIIEIKFKATSHIKIKMTISGLKSYTVSKAKWEISDT